MNSKVVVKSNSLLVAMVFGLLAIAPSYADDKAASLTDFDWTINKTRPESSVKRQTLSSSLLTGFDVEDFKSKDGKLTILTVTLKAKKTGKIALTPELFLAFDGSFYNLCQGVRVVEPKPKFGPGAFMPPSGGSSTDTISVTIGQSIVMELLFTGKLTSGNQILTASPSARIP